MSHPPITVLMPAYNARKYIGEAIDSVLRQSFRDFELLIIDDGSTDDTVNLIRKYEDPRIRLIQSPHLGVAPALNLGLQEARGYLVARFDADDICYENRLQEQFDFMCGHPDYLLVGAEADYVDMNGEYVFTLRYRGYTDEEIRKLAPLICPFSHVTVMYRKAEVLKAGGYAIHAHTFEDHLLWLKLVQSGKLCNLPKPLVKVRFNPESVTIDEKWRGPKFNALKQGCLQKGFVTKEEGQELLAIIREQNLDKIKKGSYYSLVAKKYLWDNHHPSKARQHLGKLINCYPARPSTYMLYMASFLPKELIRFLYRNMSKRAQV